MYTTNPEDHLTSRGLLYKVETKHDDSLRKEQKIHEMQIEDVKVSAELEDKKWRSCCFELHQESSLFFAKLSVSILVISLCSFQLIMLEGCNYQSLYSSILSSVITFWLSKK